MVNDDVASFSSGLGTNDSLGGNDLSSERSLVLVDVHRNGGLIVVGLGLKKVLLGGQRGAESSLRGRGKCRGASDASSKTERELNHSSTLD